MSDEAGPPAALLQLGEILASGDPERFSELMPLYAPDARFVDPSGSVEGAEAIVHYLQAQYRRVGSTTTHLEPLVGGGVAWILPWAMQLAGGRVHEGLTRFEMAGERVQSHRDYYGTPMTPVAPVTAEPEPTERSPQGAARAKVWARIEDVAVRGAGLELGVASSAGAARVEVLPGGPGRPAFALARGWGVSYVGRGGQAGRLAATYVARAIEAGAFDPVRHLGARLDEASTSASPQPRCLGGASVTAPSSADDFAEVCGGCLDRSECAGAGSTAVAALRPTRSHHALAHALRVLGSFGAVEPAVLTGLSVLEPLVAGRLGAYELSFKARGGALAEGPRVTAYAPRGADGKALARRVLGELDPQATALHSAVERLTDRFTFALGFVVRDSGWVTKLYATPPADPSAEDERALARVLREVVEVVEAAGGAMEAMEVPPLDRLRSLGLTRAADGSLRVRTYLRVERSRVTDDPRADAEGCVAMEHPGDHERVATYAHYMRTHLTPQEVRDRAALEPALASQILHALFESGARSYVTFIGFGAETRTIYAQVGPRPREVPGHT